MCGRWGPSRAIRAKKVWVLTGHGVSSGGPIRRNDTDMKGRGPEVCFSEWGEFGGPALESDR